MISCLLNAHLCLSCDCHMKARTDSILLEMSLPTTSLECTSMVQMVMIFCLSPFGRRLKHFLDSGGATCVLIFRVTHQVVANLPLISKQKFCFGLARPGQVRPNGTFVSEVNGRFVTI